VTTASSGDIDHTSLGAPFATPGLRAIAFAFEASSDVPVNDIGAAVAARLQHPRYLQRQMDKRLPQRQSGLTNLV
jgi:hypothetical protein